MMRHAIRWVAAALLISAASAAGARAEAPPDTVTLTGAVRGGEVVYSAAELKALPQTGFTTPIYHDSWGWPDEPSEADFSGVRLADLLDLAEAEGETITVVAADGYMFPIEIAEIRQYGALLALEQNGEPLLGTDKGPAWIAYPLAQFPEIQGEVNRDKWVWAVVEIIVE